MKQIKCVLLDFDGTTADTTPSIIHCIDRVLEPEGLSIDHETIARNTGYTPSQAFRLLAGCDDEQRVERIVQAYRKLYIEEGLAMITLFPRVLDTLRKLREMGIKTAIASNNISPLITEMAQRLGMSEHLDTIVGIDHVAEGKPKPDIALEAMRRLGCEPDQTLMVGDSTFDILMGRAAGCHTCGVTYGSHDRATLLGAGAEQAVDDFADILQFITQE